jgi:hypothetical protein
MNEPDRSPVHFIFASPRSGTTWLARALHQHPDILATEQRLFGDFCQLFPNADGSATPRQTLDSFVRNFSHHYQGAFGTSTGSDFYELLLRQFLSCLVEFGLRSSNKRMLIDKVTPYLGTSAIVLNKISQYFPAARIIHLVRDGRDVVTSGVFDWIQREPPGSCRRRWFVDGDHQLPLKRFFDDRVLGEWCRYWNEPQQAILNRKPARILTVRYEDMLANQPHELGRCFDFLSLDYDAELCERCAEAVTFKKTTGRMAGDEAPLEKARKGIQGDWRNYFTRADAIFFQERCRNLLEHWGYVENDVWVTACAEELELTGPSRQCQ